MLPVFKDKLELERLVLKVRRVLESKVSLVSRVQLVSRVCKVKPVLGCKARLGWALKVSRASKVRPVLKAKLEMVQPGHKGLPVFRVQRVQVEAAEAAILHLCGVSPTLARLQHCWRSVLRPM